MHISLSSQNNLTLLINILIHIFILFIFLSGFFFYYIAKKEEESLNNQVDFICKKIPDILKTLDERDKNKVIKWETIKYKTEQESKYDDLDLDEHINYNNNNLKYISVVISITILILIFLIYIYSNLSGNNINISYIITENIFIFIFIGMIEFLFFKNVASKYIPIFPVDVSTTLLERIKYNIMNMT
jgi:hypothetical protein